MNIEQKYMDKIMSSYVVDEDTGCWEWQRGKNSCGYGKIWVGDRTVAIHRVMCPDLDLDSDLSAIHKCDNPGCINPDHLYAGTHAQNMRDKRERGKPAGKLSRDDVIDIHMLNKMGVSRADISKQKGCSQSNVSLIISGKTWPEVYNTFSSAGYL